jgi:hypothetical protein
MGTMFRTQTAQGGTDAAAAPSNSGSALNQALNPDTPTGGGRGDNTKSNPVKTPVKKAFTLVEQA